MGTLGCVFAGAGGKVEGGNEVVSLLEQEVNL